MSKKMFEDLFDDEIKELTKLNLPDPSTLDIYKRLARREVYWNQDIYDDLVDISMDIINWNREDKGKPVEQRIPIKIFVNSDGGDLVAVLNLIDTIKLSKTPVYTIGLGKVYSSGGLLLFAGHKRFIFPHTSALIHSGSTGTINNVDKVIDYTDFTKKQEKEVKDYILSKTKITSKVYDKNYRKDWFLLASEMIEFGLADKIIEDLDEIL